MEEPDGGLAAMEEPDGAVARPADTRAAADGLEQSAQPYHLH